MDANAIPISENTTVIVKASGDLFLRGEEINEVRFESSEDRIRINQSNNTLYIETHANLDLSVPHQAMVVVEKVGGSAFLQDLAAPLVVQKVGGDLALQRTNAITIEKAGGSCLIEGVGEMLTVRKVGGDLTVRQVSGPVTVETIGGSGDLQVLGTGPVSARAGGDLQVYITASVDAPVNLRAGGRVELTVPARTSALFNLTSDSETIQLRLLDQPGFQQDDFEERRREFQLGDGGPEVVIRAGGDIRVTDKVVEPQPITEVLERRQNAWMEARERRNRRGQAGASWSGGFGFDRSSAWADMISRRAYEASRRAEQRVQSAMRRTDEQLRRAAERDLHRPVGRGGFVPAPPEPSGEPVSERERLIVLQMLQEGKISVEQAEKLLAALEGRFGR